MGYNLLENAYIQSNTSVGNVALSINDIFQLTHYFDFTKSLADNDILCIDIDLGARIKIDSFKYYFNSTASSGTVLNTLSFFYKNEVNDSYTYTNVAIGDGFYFSTPSGSVSPRFFRFLHTISGTSISGCLTYFSIFNDDTYIDFGETGNLSEFTAATAVIGSTANIKTIPIYNNSLEKATANIILEAQGTVIDSILTIASNYNGPWYGLNLASNKIVTNDNWVAGIFSNTDLINNKLTISYNNDTGDMAYKESSGTYTTPIFKAESFSSFINIDKEAPAYNSAVKNNSFDNIETIKLKSTNLKPMDYFIYRKLVKNSYSNLVYSDYWMHNDSLKTESSPLRSITTLTDYFIATTEENEFFGGLLYYNTNSNTYVTVFKITSTGVFTEVVLSSKSGIEVIDCYFYKIVLDSNNGFWFYMKCEESATDTLVNADGYYLCHYNSSLTKTFSLYSDSSFVYDMSVSFDEDALWYTNKDLNRVIKISSAGDIIAQYQDPAGNLIKGVCALSDGGCRFVIDNAIKRLNQYGTLIDDDVISLDSDFVYNICIANDTSLWILDDKYVKRIDLYGRILSSVYVTAATYIITNSYGVLVRCTDGNWHLIGIESGEVDYNGVCSGVQSIIYYSYDSIYAGNRFPIAIDTTWQVLSWKEVYNNYYELPTDRYYQLLLTLNVNNPDDLYNVDSTETWTPDDNFNGTSLKEHRWVTTFDTDRIVVYDNKVLLKPDSDPSADIVSFDTIGRWFINCGVEDSFDIQFKYNIPVSPPLSEAYIYLYAYSLEAGRYVDDYYLAKATVVSGTTSIDVSYVGEDYELQSGALTNGTTTYINGYDYYYGYIRLIKDGATTIRAYNYNYDTSSWVYASVGLSWYNMAGHHQVHVGDELCIKIKADYDGGNVEISEFKVNSGSCYWYNTAPVINGIYYNKILSLPDISPNSYKEIYLRSYITDEITYEAVGNYSTNLKVWWDI